ncbi:MAG: chalcone isomerase family protein [Planctomycetota bacterium]|jgi:hypothetical protein
MSRPKLRPLLAAFLASSLGLTFAGAASFQDVPTVRQKDTKVDFPVRIQPVPTDAPDAKPGAEEHLVGTALRDKTIFGVDVYAYALYLEPRAAQANLARWGDATAKQLAKDDAFYTAIYAGEPIAKTMRLVFVRNVDGEDVAEAFEGSLAPRVRKAKDSLELGDGTAALATFKGYFSLDKLRKGNMVEFSIDTNGRLTTRVAGQVMPAIDSPALAWALIDTFIGDDPIEDKGKRDLVSMVPELLDRELPPAPAEGNSEN